MTYQIESNHFQDGLCSSVQEAVSTLPGPFSVTSPLPSNSSNLSRAQTSLISFLGLTNCSAMGPTFIQMAGKTDPTATSSIPSATSSGAAALQSSKPDPKLHKKEKLIIILTTTVPLSALILLGILAYRKKRHSRSTAARDEDKTSSPRPSTDNTQPYLQKKPELEAEARAKYELETYQRTYELPGEDAIHEMPNGKERRIISRLQELRGAEHSVELETL